MPICMWCPGTPSWYAVVGSLHSGNLVRPFAGYHVLPGRERSSLGGM